MKKNYTISSSWEQKWDICQRVRKRKIDKINRTWVPASCKTFYDVIWMLFFFFFLVNDWKWFRHRNIFLAWRKFHDSLNFESHQSERLHICSGILKKEMRHFKKKIKVYIIWEGRPGDMEQWRDNTQCEGTKDKLNFRTSYSRSCDLLCLIQTIKCKFPNFLNISLW